MKTQRGFTLVEMAVVLVLVGIVSSMGMKIVGATLENVAYSDTKTKAEKIKVALTGFLRTNGRLPCPDILTPPTGIEPAGCATAASGYGVVPWLSIGLTKDTAMDGWNNFYTYRVANINFAPANVSVTAVPRANNTYQNWTIKSASGFNILSINSPTTGGYTALQIDRRDLADAVTPVAYNAVAVIYSHGKNGLSAITAKGTPNTASAAADEMVNSGAGATRFIIRDSVDSVQSGAYDDFVAYMTPQDLLQPLVTEGTIRACTSYCPTISCTNPNGTFGCTSNGIGFCSAIGVAPGCTSNGTAYCSDGMPQCALPVSQCRATGIPIGNPNVICL